MNRKETLISHKKGGNSPLEDRALKGAAQLFGEELMLLLGIKEKVKRIAPTEQIYLNPKDFLLDFNYEMEEGNWTHLEFESDSIHTKDLRRYRSYEAITSYHYGVDVTTCVLCSAETKKLKKSLKTGINTYHVKVLRLKDTNADQMLCQLEKQQKKNGRLRRSDLLQILLTPLMSGKLPLEDRIQRGLELLKSERNHLETEELMRMEAVLYTFAMKFLKEEQLKNLKEMMHMTILGEMILQDGIEIGRKDGIEIGREDGRREGEDMVNRLNTILIETGRMDDLKRAAKDREFQKSLIEELLPFEVNKRQRIPEIIEKNEGKGGL